MNLIKYFLKLFDVFFHRHNSLKKMNDDNKGQGPNHESFSGNSTTPIKADNKDENHYEGNNNPTNNVNKTNKHTIRANRPYTVQVIPFLKSELHLDYNGRYIVNYSISDSRVMEFPVIRAPKKVVR